MMHKGKRELLIMFIFLLSFADGAVLHKSFGLSVSNDAWNDTDRCTIYSLDSSSDVVDSFFVIPECRTGDITDSCYIHPINNQVVYPLFISDAYTISNNYSFCVLCGSNVTCQSELIEAPTITVNDYNAYPQIFTLMRFTGQTDTEEQTECTAIISHEGTVTDVQYGITTSGKGIFHFERFIIVDSLYTEYNLNVTCNDGSQYNNTFKPVILDIGMMTSTGWGIGFSIMFIIIGLISIVIVMLVAYYVYNMVINGLW